MVQIIFSNTNHNIYKIWVTEILMKLMRDIGRHEEKMLLVRSNCRDRYMRASQVVPGKTCLSMLLPQVAAKSRLEWATCVQTIEGKWFRLLHPWV